MRLLKVVVEGAGLFTDEIFSMDFYAAGRVNGGDGAACNHVHHLGEDGAGHIYTQNVVGITGVNASGKSTALRLVQLALDLLGAPYSMRGDMPHRLIPAKMREKVAVQVIFWQDGSFYLLESELHVVGATGRDAWGRDHTWYRIEDETIWRLTVPRPTKAMVGDVEAFKRNAEVFMRRNGDVGDDKAIPAEARRFLRDDTSIAIGLGGGDLEEVGGRFEPDAILRTSYATKIVRAFDSSVEYLVWDKNADVFRLKYVGEGERMVSPKTVLDLLSHGTVAGIALAERALEQLRLGGFMLVDEIEYALNTSLIKVLIELFQSRVSNPYGAQLVFTTRRVEVLDNLLRKDDVYLLVRGRDHVSEVVKYAESIRDSSCEKSEAVPTNVIKGTMPNYPAVEGLRAYVRGM